MTERVSPARIKGHLHVGPDALVLRDEGLAALAELGGRVCVLNLLGEVHLVGWIRR